jgi:electron transfer flavoprotein alpha subunit
MTYALILAQCDENGLNASLAPTITAARAMADKVDVLIAANASSTEDFAKKAASYEGIARVLVAEAAHYEYMLAEQIAPLVVSLAENYSHVVTAATTTGKDILPRIAALLDIQQVSDITEVLASDTFKRPIYAGNALEIVQSSDRIKVVSIRPTSFDNAVTGGNAAIEKISATDAATLTEYVSMETSGSDRPDLATASIVISGGRGIGSAENFAILEGLADKLGAAIGASRAAVDAGYVPNDYQVGQTGKVVAPQLYIAVGISGAIQHLAGMKESKVIVAINKDENAPIFEIADYGLVGDLFDIIPELTNKL